LPRPLARSRKDSEKENNTVIENMENVIIEFSKQEIEKLKNLLRILIRFMKMKKNGILQTLMHSVKLLLK